MLPIQVDIKSGLSLDSTGPPDTDVQQHLLGTAGLLAVLLNHEKIDRRFKNHCDNFIPMSGGAFP